MKHFPNYLKGIDLAVVLLIYQGNEEQVCALIYQLEFLIFFVTLIWTQPSVLFKIYNYKKQNCRMGKKLPDACIGEMLIS